MHVERYGNGSCAWLCLHGWNGNHKTFQPLAGQLSPGHSLWCPDLPDRQTLMAVTDELQALALTLPGPLKVIGNCSGALQALLLAERMPVDEIVMIDAFAYWPMYFKMFLTPGLGRYAYLSAFANPVGRWIANTSVARHRQASTDLTQGFRMVDHAAVYRQLQLLAGIGSPERFRGIRANVRITYGEKSFAAVKRSVALWKEIFPQATTHELAGAGHLPLLEATHQLTRIIFEEKMCITR